jgi:hypothetical protein
LISLNIEPAKWVDAIGNIFTAKTSVVRGGSTLSASSRASRPACRARNVAFRNEDSMNTNSVTIALLLTACFAGNARSQCLPVQDSDRARLIDYVQKKYKAPASIQLEITGISPVASTCYRKLEFGAKGSNASFHLELYASPDLRFLARELLDSTVDPSIEERRKADALAAGLTRSDLPSIGKRDAPVTIALFSDFQCP